MKFHLAVVDLIGNCLPLPLHLLGVDLLPPCVFTAQLYAKFCAILGSGRREHTDGVDAVPAPQPCM